MADDIKQLTRKRGSAKAKLTNFKNFIEDLQKKSVDSVISAAEFVQLEFRIENSGDIKREFQDVQGQIELLVDDAQFDEQLKHNDAFQTDYFNIMGQAKELLTNRKPNVGTESTVGAGVSEIMSEQGSIESQSLKLPTIELPKFSGKYEEWLEFRDTYESLIHNNSKINDIQKYHYLRASLVGNAAQVIRSLDFTAAYYPLAWETLLKRYNNEGLLIHNHLKTFFDIQSVQKDSSHSIRNLVDTATKHLRSLKVLNEPVEQWDTILIFLLSSKLDKLTARDWESNKPIDRKPFFDDFANFLRSKAAFLETLEFKEEKTPKGKSNPALNKKSFVANADISCYYCNNAHSIYKCERFINLSADERKERVTNLGLCLNCLGKGHVAASCKRGPCRICKNKHNTLLHVENPPQAATVTYAKQSSMQVLLATACVSAFGARGTTVPIRVLLDCGSQVNFMTQDCCKRLNIQPVRTNMAIIGVNNSISRANCKCDVKLQSNTSPFNTTVTCYVLPDITGTIPNHNIHVSNLQLPDHVKLADPSFFKPGQIDMLLGGGVFWELLNHKTIYLKSCAIQLQDTKFGYVVTGALSAPTQVAQCNLLRKIEVQSQLEKFWEIEEISNTKALSTDEEACEALFQESIRRAGDGKYEVTIPFKYPVNNLGSMKESAISRFQSLERKFARNEVFHSEYKKFMKEYEELGHMSRFDETRSSDTKYYLPHHGVINNSSTSTKLRVVFDGSAVTSSGWSLNDLQYAGPNIQQDLLSITLRFRQHRYVIGGDIEKMYRQIWVTGEQRPLQLILWRPHTTDPLQTYSLDTVTYGTASAPYLAIRCLKQAALDYSNNSETRSCIMDDFYVDDLLTGSNDCEELVNRVTEISTVLMTAGFKLRKWVSNSQAILKKIDQGSDCTDGLLLLDDKATKTLGLYWSCTRDTLHFKINVDNISNQVTKRNILSGIAQIYDPMGLISPCVIGAKILLQDLWRHNLAWDDHVPRSIAGRWMSFVRELTHLSSVQIPRHVLGINACTVELHGFADASQDAYGACVYVRSICPNRTIYVQLLCSKTRVAPLKPVTIPRLELCAAVMVAELMERVRNSWTIKFNSQVCWSDSTITLHWIQTPANQLQVFVSNRVAKIQHLSSQATWRHVRSEDNPADLLSRGVLPHDVHDNQLWWQGPGWLRLPESNWPLSIPILDADPPEMKRAACISVIQHEFPLDKISSMPKLIRIIAYCHRFINNCKLSQLNRTAGPITTTEYNTAMISIIRIAQADTFSKELKLLKSDSVSALPKQIVHLTPFLDNAGTLRVGGRLDKSDLPYETQHPALLSSKHPFTRSLCRYIHETNLHAPPRLLLSVIREKFWILGGRSLTRHIVHNCIVCFKVKPRNSMPLMGSLPEERINKGLPFSIVGIDYAGPLTIKGNVGRGTKHLKCYVCIFVCFITKAIHIELVTDLTTEAFLAAFRRMCSRRGKPNKVYTDNGTNFVGASSNLKQLYDFIKDNEVSIKNNTLEEGITWHFIPPQSPHFGGLWEAGVKSVKYHLHRVLGNLIVTYEHLSTVLTQIEGILNSRPLTPLSSDPSDFLALTPAHLLIGRTITSIPDPNVAQLPVNRLSLYQHLQQVQQHFWTRWSKEYISELQTRQKWNTSRAQLKVDTVVLIKDDKTPPLKWNMGRVIQTFPGQDGIPRVAAIKTKAGLIKRSVAKICPLPIDL